MTAQALFAGFAPLRFLAIKVHLSVEPSGLHRIISDFSKLLGGLALDFPQIATIASAQIKIRSRSFGRGRRHSGRLGNRWV